MVMIEYLWSAVILLLALYGAAQGVGRLMGLLWRLPQDTPAVLVLPLKGHHEDVEYLLRCAENRYRWAGVPTRTRLAVADAGMDDETRRLAEDVCTRLEIAEFWTEERVRRSTSIEVEL